MTELSQYRIDNLSSSMYVVRSLWWNAPVFNVMLSTHSSHPHLHLAVWPYDIRYPPMIFVLGHAPQAVRF